MRNTLSTISLHTRPAGQWVELYTPCAVVFSFAVEVNTESGKDNKQINTE